MRLCRTFRPEPVVRRFTCWFHTCARETENHQKKSVLHLHPSAPKPSLLRLSNLGPRDSLPKEPWLQRLHRQSLCQHPRIPRGPRLWLSARASAKSTPIHPSRATTPMLPVERTLLKRPVVQQHPVLSTLPPTAALLNARQHRRGPAMIHLGVQGMVLLVRREKRPAPR